MTDRLAELTAGMSNEDMVTIDIHSDEESELDDETEIALTQFRKECGALSTAIDRIHENIETVNSRYQVSMDERVEEEDKVGASQDITKLVQETEKTSDAIRKRLLRIAGENKSFSQDFPGKTGQLRVRINAHTGLTRRFMQSMDQFEQAQERHANVVKRAIESHMREMNPDVSEEDILDAVRRGSTEQIIEQSTTFSTLPLEEQVRLRNGLSDLQSRNNDIKKLEESIVQLHQLFVDMQVLVAAQGELLNDIEFNIVETKGKTETGLHELVEAHSYQKSAKKKKLCCIALIVIILLCVVVPVLVTYIPKWFPQTQEVFDQIGLGNDSGNSTQTATAAPDSISGEDGASSGSKPPTRDITQEISLPAESNKTPVDARSVGAHPGKLLRLYEQLLALRKPALLYWDPPTVPDGMDSEQHPNPPHNHEQSLSTIDVPHLVDVLQQEVQLRRVRLRERIRARHRR